MSARLLLVMIALVTLNGCALFQPASNDARLAKISGSDFVISVPDTEVDLNQLPVIGADEATVMRLIRPDDARQAYQSNGNRLPGAVTLNNPSASILNALSKYYTREHELRFIARGTIRNLDPDFINRALKRGDYVLDVRLSHLELLATNNGQFYPSAAYQLTVVDRAKARYVIQDECRFSQANQPQALSYYTARNGANLSRFLQRFASPCLQYFAKGTPLPEQAQVSVAPPPARQSTSSIMTRYSVGVATRYYPDYGTDPIWLNSGSFGVSQLIAVTPTLAIDAGFQALTFKANGVPSFDTSSYYGGEISGGLQYFPEGDLTQGYRLLLRGQIAQSRQTSVRVSTNALGLSAGLSRSVLSDFLVGADYTYWQHVGPTHESNISGHELRFSFGYHRP